MSHSWFRLYSEFASDPKVQILAFEDQRHFVVLLCLKSNGTLDTKAANADYRHRLISKALGLDPVTCAEAQRRLVDAGLVDDSWQPLAWNDRQFVSDSSVSRVKRYRANREANGLSRSWDEGKHSAAIVGRDGDKSCVYCGSTDAPCIDHMVPIRLGGTDDISNLAFACKQCNSGKAGRTPSEAGYKFVKLSASNAHNEHLSRPVTVSVTPQIQRQRQIQIQIKTRTARTAPRETAKPKKVPRESPPDPEWFAEFKLIYPPRSGDQAWRKALRAANARFAEGHTPAEMVAGARRYRDFCLAKGDAGSEFVKQSATFLGPDKGFLLPWHAPPKPETAMDRLMRMTSSPTDDRTIDHVPEFSRFIAND